MSMAAVNVPIVADENVPFRGGDEPHSGGLPGRRRLRRARQPKPVDPLSQLRRPAEPRFRQQPLGDGLERSFASLSPPSSTGGGHGKRGPHSGQADLAPARSSSSESGHSSTPYGQATVCVSGSILTFRYSSGSSQLSKPPFPTRPLTSTWPSVPYSKRIQRRYSSRASISMVFSIGRPSCSSGSIS